MFVVIVVFIVAVVVGVDVVVEATEIQTKSRHMRVLISFAFGSV